jgi:hypothetical protein
MLLTVRFENAYDSGHECPPREVEMGAEPDVTPAELEDLFWYETGCACEPYQGSTISGSWYGATVIACEDRPDLIGHTVEWSD